MHGITLKAARADNFYHPPNWDPSKMSMEAFHGSKGVNQWQISGKIRFETPWNMYCTSCNNHIAQGVRFNAKKKRCGEYFSTTLYEFIFTCILCKGPIIIQTDPENRDYKCVKGCRRARSSFVNAPPKKKRKIEDREVEKTFENVFNLPTKKLKQFDDGRGAVFALTLTNNGKYLLAAGSDRTIRLYNPYDAGLVKEFKGGHGQAIRDIAVRHDNQGFASCGGDQGVCIWDVTKQIVVRKVYGHIAKVNTVAYNENASILASASDDSCLCLWDLKNGRGNKPLQKIKCFKDSVLSVKITDDSVITGCVDGHLRVFDLRKGQQVDDNIKHAITSVAVSGDQRCILVSCIDDTIRLMDQSDGTMLQKYTGHKTNECVVSSCFSNDDAYVLSGSSQGYVHIWNLVEGKQVACLQGHQKLVTRVVVHPKKPFMFTSSQDGTVQMWGTESLPVSLPDS